MDLQEFRDKFLYSSKKNIKLMFWFFKLGWSDKDIFDLEKQRISNGYLPIFEKGDLIT